MFGKNIRTKQGFTIIEVVLVLAIAGLIFLMVFVALPQLQRNQRDAQRRNDIARVATALAQYQTNNKGRLPISANNNGDNSICSPSNAGTIKPNSANTYANLGSGNPAKNASAACKFIATYLNSSSSATNEFVDPDGTSYGISIYHYTDNRTISNLSFNHRIYIITNSKCSNSREANTISTGNSRNYAILYKLEGSGTYCADNQ